MDIVDAFSSESDDNHQSHNSEGRETISTESHRHSEAAKTKNIKKRYEPIMDGGKLVKYEDNPTEYKRLRKYFCFHLGKFRTERVQLASEAGRKMHLRIWSKRCNTSESKTRNCNCRTPN